MRTNASSQESDSFPRQGPQRTVFGPFALVDRIRFGAVLVAAISALLLGVVFAYTLSRAPELLWILCIVGVMYGYFTHRRRSLRPRVQIIVTTLVPLVISGFFVIVSQLPGATVASLGLLPAVVLGHCLARAAESRFGPVRKVHTAAWEGVVTVGSERPGGIRFNIRPLFERVTQDDIEKIRPHVPQSSLAVRSRILKTLFIVAAPLLVVVIIVGFIDEATQDSEDVAAQLVGFSAFVMLLILAYGVIAWFGFRGTRHATTLKDHVRFAKFASINNFFYHPGPLRDDFGRHVSRVLTISGGRFWRIANATRTEPLPAESSAASTTFSGYCEVQLDVPLPNLLLVSKGFRLPSFSSHVAPKQDQRLSLEGNFDRHFELYCPQGYERDALYILTPDVMANLIDGSSGFDVEFIDDRLVLRTRGDMVTLDPAQWQRIALAVNALKDRIQQWSRWRDDQLDEELVGIDSARPPHLITEKPTGVALAGRRLRLGLSVGGVLTLGFFGVYGALVYLANAL